MLHELAGIIGLSNLHFVDILDDIVDVAYPRKLDAYVLVAISQLRGAYNTDFTSNVSEDEQKWKEDSMASTKMYESAHN